MILFAHFSLFAMQPQGLGRIRRCFEQLSARVLRPGQVHVFMNDAQAIMLAPDAKKSIILSTGGLTGCTASVLYAKDHAERQHAILMHYHPNHHKEHLTDLEQQIHLLMNHATLFKSMKFLSILPSTSHRLDFASHTAECYEKRKALEEMVQKTSMYPHINMLHTTYDLAPTGKCYFAEVYVTLANDAPSKCSVSHWGDGYRCVLE